MKTGKIQVLFIFCFVWKRPAFLKTCYLNYSIFAESGQLKYRFKFKDIQLQYKLKF